MTNQPKPKWILGKPETHRGNHTLHVKVEASKLKKQATEVGAKPTTGSPGTDGKSGFGIVKNFSTPNQDNNFEQELTKILEHFRSDLRSDSMVGSSVRMVEAKTALNKLYQSSLEEAYSQGYDDCLKEHGFTNIQSKSLTKDQEDSNARKD